MSKGLEFHLKADASSLHASVREHLKTLEKAVQSAGVVAVPKRDIEARLIANKEYSVGKDIDENHVLRIRFPNELEIEAAAEIKKLRAALKPFADACKEIIRDYGERPGHQFQFPAITMDKFIAARDAYGGKDVDP